MVYPSGKQLSIVARAYYEYLLAAAKNIVQQNADTTFSTLEPIHG